MWYEQMAWKPTFSDKVIQRSLHTKCNADSSCSLLYMYHLGLLYYKCYSPKMSIYIGVISVVIDTLELSRYQFRKFTKYCGWPLEQRSLYIFCPLYLSSLAISILFDNCIWTGIDLCFYESICTQSMKKLSSFLFITI